jgi:hypothetical protein
MRMLTFVFQLLCIYYAKKTKTKSSNINLKERKVERTWGTKRKELLRVATKVVICNNCKGSDGCENLGVESSWSFSSSKYVISYFSLSLIRLYSPWI